MSVCAVSRSGARSLCSQLNKVLLQRKQVLVKHFSHELRDKEVAVSHSAAVVAPEMLPGKGGFKEKGGHCKSGCSIHLANSQSVEGESKPSLLHLRAASIVQHDTLTRLKANTRHVQKAAGSGPDAHGGLCRAEPGALCRLGSSVINVGDMHMAVKPEGCRQAVRRK